MKEKYNIFGAASAIYAVFLTFCLYYNAKGITFPFFVAGTLFYFCFCMKKSGVSKKKDDLFYFISLMLLGISVFLTMDLRIIAITKVGIFLLFVSFLLHHFYDDSKWNFTKYLQSIIEAVLYSIGSLFAPAKDLLFYFQEKKKPVYDENGKELPREESKLKYFLIGILIAIPLLVVIIFALSSADVVFRDMSTRFFDFIRIDTLIRVVIMTVIAYFVSYAILHSLLKKEIREACTGKRDKEPLLAITFTSVISVIYLLFSGIQIVYLFAGNGALPEGYTYAQYARQGFYELLFVCMLNVVILLICVSLFKESRILKGILCVITACTYLMMVSSAYRMYLYVSAYHFTFLRLMVFFFLSLMAVLMIGIFITIFKNTFPLFRYSMIVITAFTIVLAYSHPDYLTARYNVAHIKSDSYDYNDIQYLTSLCEDSAPVLLQKEVFEKLREISPKNIDEYYARCYYKVKGNPGSFRTFNVSHYLLQKSFAGLIPEHEVSLERWEDLYFYEE